MIDINNMMSFEILCDKDVYIQEIAKNFIKICNLNEQVFIFKYPLSKETADTAVNFDAMEDYRQYFYALKLNFYTLAPRYFHILDMKSVRAPHHAPIYTEYTFEMKEITNMNQPQQTPPVNINNNFYAPINNEGQMDVGSYGTNMDFGIKDVDKLVEVLIQQLQNTSDNAEEKSNAIATAEELRSRPKTDWRSILEKIGKFGKGAAEVVGSLGPVIIELLK